MKNTVDIDVEKVANLAKLRLTQDEKDSMKSDMAAIIGFADKLTQADTSQVGITAHIVPITNVLREDVVTNKPDRDALLSNASTEADGYITVPKTFE